MQRRALLALLTLAALPTACDRDADAEDGDADAKKKGTKSKKKSAKNDDGSIGAPKPGDLPILKVGAWSRYRMESGTVTFAVVERRNDTEWLVDAKVEGPMPILIQAWVDVPDLRDAKGIEMKEATAKLGAGPVRKVSFGDKSPTAMMFSKIMGNIIPQKLEGLPQEDVTVEAGTFRKCYRWKNEQTFMGIKVKETIWTHPAVPVPSMVKSESDDGKGGFELIAYDTKGAKKSF